MRLFRWFWIALLLSSIFRVAAQTSTTPQLGDPPVAALLSISPADENGIVTITGAPGAVFPAAQVAVRNLYTEQVVYVGAGITGSFTAQIYGPGNTPFWISPAPNIPNTLRNRPGSLPGGPGTIIYGPLLEARAQPDLVTQLIMDGSADDWAAYPQADVGEGNLALVNHESLYVFVPETVDAGSQLELTYTLDEITYAVTLNPSLPQAALLRQIAPVERDLGAVPAVGVLNANGGGVEVRVPLETGGQTAILERVVILTDGTIAFENTLAAAVPIYDEHNGIVYPGGRMSGELRRFSISGPLAQGASVWTATGRVNTLRPVPGGTVTMELDVTLTVPDLPPSLVGLELLGEIGLQPVAVGSDSRNVTALLTNNGWSNVLTPSGLAVDNLQGDLPLGSATVPAAQVIRRGSQLLAGFRFELTIPDDLPIGLYVPTFQGTARVADGEIFAWEDNSIFGTGSGISRLHLTRLPVVLNVGSVNESRLLWSLLYDHPSDGSRGILSEEDTGRAALSNRVRLNSPTYILPPGSYPLEPYLLNLMPNLFDLSAAPLLPLLFPGGRLNAVVTYPDGEMDDLADAPIVQNRLSTVALNERERFGGQSPVDAYRLTTGNPSYTAYPFEQYGEYEVGLTGVFEDIYGNRYTGGGTYHLLIAELLDLTPGVLPGMPFHVGDVFFAGGRVSPGVPATVDVHLRVYTLDGDVIERSFTRIQADRHGFFTSDDEGFRFESPGEYVVDYEARYEDTQGRLWAASLRSAGVIASSESTLIAHGKSGVPGYAVTQAEDYRPAWFTTALYPPGTSSQRLYYPYFVGDVAVVRDGVQGGILPVLTVQDVGGSYEDWLRGTKPEYISAEGMPLETLTTVDELPVIPILGGPQTVYDVSLKPDLVVNQAYTYISAVRPDITVRQYVTGGDNPVLPLDWDSDDAYNEQIGAGVDGDRPGDYLFLFGGAVVRNPEAGLNTITPYAALAVVGGENVAPRIYPPYRGAAGGPDGGALFSVRREEINLFFHPTGVRPGQVMTVGDLFVIVGQAAPTLESQVSVTVTAPGGDIRTFSGATSPTGYYYDPETTFVVDEPGIWTVNLLVTPMGASSAGLVEPPLPEGGVLGAAGGTFTVFVLPKNADPLAWSQDEEVDIAFRPGVPFNFGFTLPEEWAADARMFYYVTTPSYVLDSGEIRRAGNTFSYQYSPATIANNFPNLEFDGRGTGSSASDVVTLTFVMLGTQAESGQEAIRSRTFAVFHDRLISFEGVAGE